MTNGQKINMNQAGESSKPKILVSPLDWGLGHATRCIPVIRYLLQLHCEPVLAGDGPIKYLLRHEFPQLPFIDFPGYHIRYSGKKWSLPFVLAAQIPKILSTIKYENERLRQLVEAHQIEGIISDNRYGLYHSHVPSVLITHQLLIKTPYGAIADRYLQQLHYRLINRFSECWIPDAQHGGGLAGELTHPHHFPRIPVRYIGTLSRFHNPLPAAAKHVLIIVSGPEPQRTLFETKCLDQLRHYQHPVILVRGLPGEKQIITSGKNVQVFNHLSGNALQEMMEASSVVISRSGYSTVMDLAVLKKKSILVPTPGQTEQEYLGKYLSEHKFAWCIAQQQFQLNDALQQAAQFPYHFDLIKSGSNLESTVKNFVAQVISNRRHSTYNKL